METTKVVTATAAATIWTNRTGNGQFTVFRGTARIGQVTMKHRGWEASFCGVRTMHSSKARAIAELAAR